jgi:septal ring factor EnvC (AmiA/AmiB activator)
MKFVRRYDKGLQLVAVFAVCMLAAGPWTQKLLAQGSDLSGNLFRSRDALLKQRSELQDASNRIDQQLAELSRQQDRIHEYLRDTDRALNDIDVALRSTR